MSTRTYGLFSYGTLIEARAVPEHDDTDGQLLALARKVGRVWLVYRATDDEPADSPPTKREALRLVRDYATQALTRSGS